MRLRPNETSKCCISRQCFLHNYRNFQSLKVCCSWSCSYCCQTKRSGFWFLMLSLVAFWIILWWWMEWLLFWNMKCCRFPALLIFIDREMFCMSVYNEPAFRVALSGVEVGSHSGWSFLMSYSGSSATIGSLPQCPKSCFILLAGSWLLVPTDVFYPALWTVLTDCFV